MGIITLTTDFGLKDHFVGVMKGVILRINPHARIVDLSHEVEPQNILEGAYIVKSSYRFFPKDAIHVCVVDPGVGTGRRPIIIKTGYGIFVGPDNGVFSYILHDLLPENAFESGRARLSGEVRAFVIRPELMLGKISRTFHGRDVFAPCAGYLSLGKKPEEVGEEVGELVAFPPQKPKIEGRVIRGRIIHIDKFGNLITNIPEELLEGEVEIEVKGRVIRGISSSYEEGEGLLGIMGSDFTLEIALRRGSARDLLGARTGDEVIVRLL